MSSIFDQGLSKSLNSASQGADENNLSRFSHEAARVGSVKSVSISEHQAPPTEALNWNRDAFVFLRDHAHCHQRLVRGNSHALPDVHRLRHILRFWRLVLLP